MFVSLITSEIYNLFNAREFISNYAGEFFFLVAHFCTDIYVSINQDEFASLPPIVPKGPIAILGLVIHLFL